EVWWWVNPYPDIEANKPWERHTIKKSGRKGHHDLIADDFNGDGNPELVFWNQSAGNLYFAEIPPNPSEVDEWSLQLVYHYNNDGEMLQEGFGGYPPFKKVNDHEGLFACDIDGDGVKDILAGGRWFKYLGADKFSENIIDASYTFTRTIAADFIEGGRPEVILVAGDGTAPLIMYQFQNGTWVPRVLIASVWNGHTLELVDFNKDGHADIFIGEMRLNSSNPQSEIRVLLGDGKGNFIHQTISKGIGIHEGRIDDLDGDGDMDILVKPYDWDTPRLDIYLNQEYN
nr:VCBS repeat-containing protein [Spirochaetales bacterium]